MKYIVVLGDGMADRPLEELGNKTPVEVAMTPTIDMLSKKAEIGLSKTIPEGMKPGSDTANLAVLGYDPKVYYSGRSPLEALSIGVPMKASDIALRTNIVTVEGDENDFENMIITDHSSSEISTEDAAVLLNACIEHFKHNEEFKKENNIRDDEFSFYVGTSYRHCLIWDAGKVVDLAQPHDHLTEVISAYLPYTFNESAIDSFDDIQKDGLKKLQAMMKESIKVLNHHPLNEERRKQGLNPANCLWFWGAGTKPALDSFYEKTGKKGAMISAVDLLKGIAVGADMTNIIVDGANGQLETNYEGKAQAAIDAILKDGFDFVYIHVEAPDEMGHQGSVERKIKAIEYLDRRLIANVVSEMNKSGERYRLLIMPDHATPICKRTHTSEPIPYLLYDSAENLNTKGNLDQQLKMYSEKYAELTGIVIDPGYTTIEKLFAK